MLRVVMRVTTLKASGERLGGLLAYYAGLAEDRERSGPGRGPIDYYLDPEEPPGRWWGRGGAALGVDGTVTGSSLRSVLEGRHPVTSEQLGRRFGNTSARGFDATFSAPKSVSVLWALSPDRWVRAEVLSAHDAAVTAALGWFERHGALTRRGRDGVLQVDTRGLAVAVFRQHTSRAMDPQLHTHAVIAGKVQDASGRWLSLDARFLKFQQRSIGAIYDAALRAELAARLGVEWIERDPGVFDLACIPERVREGFSKRTSQVDAKLAELLRRWSAEHDDTTPDARTISGLERAAARASRPGKAEHPDGETLRDNWVAEAHTMRFDAQTLLPQQIEDPRGMSSGMSSGIPDEDLVEEALFHASEESSTWLRADLARHLATILDPHTASTGEALATEIDRLAALAERHCVPLGPEHHHTTRHRRDGRPVTEHVTDRRFATPAVLAQEHDLQDWARRNSRPVNPVTDPQATAAHAIAGHDRLVLVVGPAGTGKTHTTARAVTALQAAGRPVIGLAPSGKAADVLAREAVCATDTVAGFLTRHRGRPSPWPQGTTVILDEAGMTATDDLARLVGLARRHGWRLAAIGDPDQLPAVGRGGLFAHWCDTLPHHALEQPRRFSHDWEARASLGLRAGQAEAVEAYLAHGRVTTSHPALVAAQVARAHDHYVAAGRTVAITTTDAETARTINREIQHCHGPAGHSVALRDGNSAHVGDQISTRRNDPSLRTTIGAQVRNRHSWTVTATRADGGLTVEHPQRGTVELPAAYVAEHVELGWAVTGYGTQGDTVDIGIAVLDTTTSRNHAYVAMTRGRHANHAVLLDPTGTQDPTEQFAQIIARPSRGVSALGTEARLHRAAGLEPPDHHDRDDHAPPSAASLDPELQARTDMLQQRLDQLQRRTPQRNEPALGR